MEEKAGEREVLVVLGVVGEASTVGHGTGFLALVNIVDIGDNVGNVITVPCGTVGEAGRKVS